VTGDDGELLLRAAENMAAFEELEQGFGEDDFLRQQVAAGALREDGTEMVDRDLYLPPPNTREPGSPGTPHPRRLPARGWPHRRLLRLTHLSAHA
jgi:hypothetical protein